MMPSEKSSPDKNKPAQKNLPSSPVSGYLSQRIRSFSCAICGLVNAWRSEANFRIHIVITMIVIVAGAFFQISLPEWTVIVFAVTLVIVAELFNTAIEKTLNRISEEIHPQTKIAKDLAAAAVFIAACGASIIGFLIFLPRLLALWHV